VAAAGAGAAVRPLKLRLPKAPVKARQAAQARLVKARLAEAMLPPAKAQGLVAVPAVSGRDAGPAEVKDRAVAAAADNP
jgi:hypothetical protein